jgi:monoamine oxidase
VASYAKLLTARSLGLLGHREIRAGRPDGRGLAASWATYGPWLRKPVDGIFWAGTETADVRTGFFDGAVRSGKRAADQVHRAVSG